MQHSSVSYRSNKYSAAESRKILGANNGNSIMQQQHIEDLQRKVDVILMHNQTLLQENNDLKRIIEETKHSTNRKYSSQSTDTLRLRKQLEFKNMELQQLTKKSILEKDNITEQLEELNLIIRKLTTSHEKLTVEKNQLEEKIDKYEYQRDREVSNLREEYQNQIYENSLKKELEHKDELRDIEKRYIKQIEEKEKRWEEERNALEEKKMELLIKMEDQYEKEKEELGKTLEHQYNQSLRKVQISADERCRTIREKTEQYLSEALQHQKRNDSQEVDNLKDQIDDLRRSLEARQKVIQGFLLDGVSHFKGDKYYEQVQNLRQRIKDLTESFFKQSELLKIKMALKHDADVREVAKVYQDRIDVLSERIHLLEKENQRLRQQYENQIRSKMKQRQKFETDTSKLKNVIRKMKIQLESYGKQLRLNIQGMKSQANSFSMSILTELGQEKNKKNFYEEQIRKMREVVELKEQEVESLMTQCQDKVKYYYDKYQDAKEKIEEYKQQLAEKDEVHRIELDSEKQHGRHELSQQRDHWMSFKEDMQKEISEARIAYASLQTKYRQLEGEKNRLESDIKERDKQIISAKAHIDAMSLEMEMLGQGEDQSPALVPLKKHYERIIQEMKEDKAALQETNSAQAEQLSKVVAKYKVLQKSLSKTLSTMKKRTQLEQKVMELGMDENLVKNLGQIFARQSENAESS